MKEKYTAPEIEIVEFEEVCMDMSTTGDNDHDSNLEWDQYDSGATWE